MTETYCVVAQVSGFATDDDVARAKAAGVKFDKNARNAQFRAEIERNAEVKVLDVLIRDDGTGEVAVVWEPAAEADGTMTWHNAKASVEDVRSAVVGAGLAQINPVKVELRTAPSKPKATKAKKATKGSERPSSPVAKDADQGERASSGTHAPQGA